MADRTLTVKIIGDERDLLRAFGKSSKAAGTFGQKLTTSARNTALAIGAVAGGIGVLGAKSVGAASDLNEQINKTNIVFARSAQNVLDWSKTTASSLGLSQRAALEAAGGFGQMLETAGLTEPVAAKFSKRLVTLAADMASFNNIDPAEALIKLKSGLAGEAEPLRTVGVLLSETRVKQEAYRLGIAKVGEELTEQQKVQARYSLILKDTAKQHGDFARTSDSLANAQRIIRASFEDIGASIGTALLPGIATATSAFADFLPTLQRSLGRISGAIAPAINAIIGTFTERLPDLQRIITSITEPFRERVLPILREFGTIALQVWSNVVAVFSQNSGNIRKILDNLGEALQNVWKIARPTIVFLFEKVLPTALRIAIPLLAKVSSVARIMSQVFVKVVGTILQAIEKFLGGLSFLSDAISRIPGLADKFGGVSDKINAARERLREFTGDLDGLNGKQVNVDVNMRLRWIGDAGRRQSMPDQPTKKAKDAVDRTTQGVSNLTGSENDLTAATNKAETAAEKQRKAFDRLMDILSLRRDRAAATRGLADDLKVLEAQEKAIRAQIKVEGRTVELERELFNLHQERIRLRQEQRRGKQFEALGLTFEGDKPIPGVGALRKRLGSLREQIKGTFLDTAKTRAQLQRIARVLSGQFGKVGREVRQAILDMLNDISSALSGGGAGQKGPLTKFRVANFSNIADQFPSLSQDDARKLQQILSRIGPGGTTPRTTTTGGAFGFEVSGGGNVIINGPITVVANDAAEFMRSLEKRKRRNAGSRTGPRVRLPHGV